MQRCADGRKMTRGRKRRHTFRKIGDDLVDHADATRDTEDTFQSEAMIDHSITTESHEPRDIEEGDHLWKT